MLANAPDVDRSTRTNRPLSEERAKGDVADVGSVGLPVLRVGLEQEFFLVDRGGALSDLADPFLRRCRDARLRAWAEADDGKPVYMLNLMRYYDELRPFPGAPDFQGSPEESNTLYTKHARRMLMKIGGYPVVAGPTQAKNLMTYESDLDDWSQVLVVRYPSRRAFLSLVADPAYGPIEPYKLMALKVVLTPVSGKRVTPDMRAVVGSALLCLFLAVGWIRAARGNQ